MVRGGGEECGSLGGVVWEIQAGVTKPVGVKLEG